MEGKVQVRKRKPKVCLAILFPSRSQRRKQRQMVPKVPMLRKGKEKEKVKEIRRRKETQTSQRHQLKLQLNACSSQRVLAIEAIAVLSSTILPRHAAKAKPAATAKPAAVAFVVGSAGISGASASNINTTNENLKKSAWSMFKSSIAALVKPFVTLLSLASSCFDSTFCLQTQGLASIASLCSGNGGGVKDFECIQEACGVPKEQAPFCFLFQTNFKEKGAPFLNTFNKDIIPQIPGDVSVKDTLHCVPAVLSNHPCIVSPFCPH